MPLHPSWNSGPPKELHFSAGSKVIELLAMTMGKFM